MLLDLVWFLPNNHRPAGEVGYSTLGRVRIFFGKEGDIDPKILPWYILTLIIL